MDSDTTSFSYPALPTGVDAIRILELHPGDFQKSLAGALSTVAFSERPKYVALSYTWQDPYPESSKPPLSPEGRRPGSLQPEASSQPTTANSHEVLTLNEKPFHIGRNLHLALLHIRSPTYPIRLWIDAICINQADIDERGYQVSLMAFIYTRATKVVAWLGIEDYYFHINTFETMFRQWEFGQTRHFGTSLIEGSKIQCSPRPDESTLTRMLNSTYWTRLWIVQEMCMPRLFLVMYGANIWTYEEIRETYTVIRSIYLDQRSPTRVSARLSQGEPWPVTLPHYETPLLLFETRDKRHTDLMRLESLIERFANSKCSDTRDRIFGLFGCANDIRPYAGQHDSPDSIQKHGDSSGHVSMSLSRPSRGAGSIKVDYSCMFYDIWANVVAFVYFKAQESKRNISMLIPEFASRLYNYHTADGTTVDLDERQISIVRTAGLVQTALGQEVEAELMNCIPDPHEQECQKIIALGYIAGEIVRLGPDYKSLAGSSFATQDWIDCWDDHYQEASDLETLRSTYEGYAARIMEYKQADLDRIRDIFNTNVSATKTARDQSNTGTVALRPIRGFETQDQTPRICLGTGYVIGLVPTGARLNDIIVRFWNCNAAIVMRYWGKDKFILIGRADVAEVINEKSEVQSAVDWISRSKLPGSSQNRHTGPLWVNLDLQTLQEITAHITS